MPCTKRHACTPTRSSASGGLALTRTPPTQVNATAALLSRERHPPAAPHRRLSAAASIAHDAALPVCHNTGPRAVRAVATLLFDSADEETPTSITPSPQVMDS